MRKLSLFYISFIAGSLLLISCSQISTFSVTKRHYRDGYYIDINSGKQAEHISQQVLKQNRMDNRRIVIAENKPENKSYTSAGATIINKKDGNGGKIANRGKVVTHMHPIRQGMNAPMTSVYKDAAIQKMVSNKKTSSQDNIDSPGYWLWTIIVLLFLVWLLSLLTGGWGLGGLIYIFLVVALILLIFRLLSVL